MLARYTVLWPCVRPSFRLVRGRGTARRQVVQVDPRREVVVHAAYCYRRAAVAWPVHPCGILLLGLWSDNRVANVQALPCFSSYIKLYCLISYVEHC